MKLSPSLTESALISAKKSRLFLTLSILLALSACSNTPPRDSLPNSDLEIKAQNTSLNTQGLCQASQFPEQLLDLLAQDLDQQQLEKAQKQLECDRAALSPTTSPEQAAWFNLLQARISLQENKADIASQLLATQRQKQDEALLPQSLQNQLNLLEADILTAQHKYIASAQLRIFNHALLSPEQQTENAQKIWQNLLKLNTSELEQALAQNRKSQLNQDLLAWLELSAIIKTHNDNLDLQIEALNKWQAQWPQHIPQNPLPEGIDDLYQMAAGRAQNIAILLPQTGRGSKASSYIQQGFLAAYYQQQKYQPNVRFYNTDQRPIIDLVDQAVNEGAEVIIGPLLKENIIQLQTLPSLPVPVLALNSLAQNFKTDNLFQISLAVEDQAEQAAEFGLQNGLQQALILVSDKTWSQRAGEAFEQHWLDHNASITAIEQYQASDMKTSIRRALELDKSAARYYAVRQVTQLALEPHKPHRRRQDVDMIFLASSHNEAKRLKPLLNHYRSYNIPVYATSKIHLDNKKEHDLNHIYFPEIPLLLNKKDRYQQILNASKNKAGAIRLQALGIDSFNLFPRLNYLAQKNHITFFGRSGDYQMFDGVLRRQLDWAKYHYGKVRKVDVAKSKSSAAPL